jgi:hypothetical protein
MTSEPTAEPIVTDRDLDVALGTPQPTRLLITYQCCAR